MCIERGGGSSAVAIPLGDDLGENQVSETKDRLIDKNLNCTRLSYICYRIKISKSNYSSGI